MIVEKEAKDNIVKTIEEVHELFKDDLAQGQVPRLPSTKEIPHGPFQVWYEKMEQTFKVTRNCCIKFMYEDVWPRFYKRKLEDLNSFLAKFIFSYNILE